MESVQQISPKYKFAKALEPGQESPINPDLCGGIRQIDLKQDTEMSKDENKSLIKMYGKRYILSFLCEKRG